MVSSLASPLSARSVTKVWRPSCQRPVTPAALRTLFQAVLNVVAGLVGSVGWGLPKGKTYHSGRVSPNLSRYQRACSTKAALRSEFIGIVLPWPASVLEFPT